MLGHRVAAAIEHADVPLDPATRTVIDVGAHTGQFALFALESLPEASVVCFEPLAGPRRVLARALEPDRGRVRIEGVAVGAAAGSGRMNVSARDDSSSLREITVRHEAAFPGTAATGTEGVELITLDRAVGTVERPCLLKVDVQGYELEVLRGAGAFLEQVDQLLVECSFVELFRGQALACDVICMLRGEGFRLSGVYGMTRERSGQCLQADLLFVSQNDDADGS